MSLSEGEWENFTGKPIRDGGVKISRSRRSAPGPLARFTSTGSFLRIAFSRVSRRTNFPGAVSEISKISPVKPGFPHYIG